MANTSDAEVECAQVPIVARLVGTSSAFDTDATLAGTRTVVTASPVSDWRMNALFVDTSIGRTLVAVSTYDRVPMTSHLFVVPRLFVDLAFAILRETQVSSRKSRDGLAVEKCRN